VKYLNKCEIEILDEHLPEAVDSVFDTEIHGRVDKTKTDGALLRAMECSLSREAQAMQQPYQGQHQKAGQNADASKKDALLLEPKTMAMAKLVPAKG
jgi:hypothetical protein